MTNLRALSILFRDLVWLNLIFTFIGVYFHYKFGDMSIPAIFWIKVVGFSVLWFGYYRTRKSRMFFYYNLGYSLKNLIVVSLTMDSLLTLIVFSVYAVT